MSAGAAKKRGVGVQQIGLEGGQEVPYEALCGLVG